MISLPDGDQFFPNGRRGLAISPSGSHIAYMANGRLYLRALDQLEPTPVRGTEAPEGNFSSTLAARDPFFSHDGRWIGFWQGGQLKKVSITGGAPAALSAVDQLLGASWGVDDTIVFGQGSKGIMRVGAQGGIPEVLIKVNNGEAVREPQILPGGRALLYTLRPQGTRTWDDSQIVVQSLDGGDRKVVINGGADARYVSSGHVVYIRQGTVFAAPFDVDASEVTGDATPLVEDVAVAAASGAGQFALSTGGTLVYVSVTSDTISQYRTLTWVDRQQRESLLKAPARAYQNPRLSPDETRVALDIRDQENDIWIWDFTRQTLARQTFDRTPEWSPLWSPDGRRLIFASSGVGMFWRAADGSGNAEALTQHKYPQLPMSLSPDGRLLVFREEMPDSTGYASLEGSDLMVMDLQGDRQAKPLVQTPFIEINAELSPDGRWLAYQSNESGRFEVYVRPFPNVDGGRWQVSAGGRMPLWSRNGRELFYVTAASDALMSVVVSATSAFTAGTPIRILDMPSTRGYFFGATGRTYDVSADGERFLMIKALRSDQTAAQSSMIVVQNWLEELKRRVPVP